MNADFDAAWLEAHRAHVGAVRRSDIIGIGHVLREVDGVVARLRNPSQLADNGAAMPRGLLFYGPPGTGKTLTARYLASQIDADCPFYEVSADELSPDRIRGSIRHLAEAHPQSVFYIDEIDTFAIRRGSDQHSVDTRLMLTAMLAALDGLTTAAGPIVVASSNTGPFFLDRALIRAGRLGFRVRFSLPDDAQRVELLEHFAASRSIEPDIDWHQIARLTRDTTPADLRQMLDDSLGLALADGRTHVGHADVLAAASRNGDIEPDDSLEKIRTMPAALHEAGHVAVAVALRGPAFVTSVQFTSHGARTSTGEEALGSFGITTDLARDLASIAYGGWAAEQEIVGVSSLGSTDDVERITALLIKGVGAMFEPGYPPVDPGGFDRELSDAAMHAKFEAVRAAAEVGRHTARAIVRMNRAGIEQFASTFLEAGHLTGPALEAAIAEAGFRRLDGAAAA